MGLLPEGTGRVDSVVAHLSDIPSIWKALLETRLETALESVMY